MAISLEECLALQQSYLFGPEDSSCAPTVLCRALGKWVSHGFGFDFFTPFANVCAFPVVSNHGDKTCMDLSYSIYSSSPIRFLTDQGHWATCPYQWSPDLRLFYSCSKASEDAFLSLLDLVTQSYPLRESSYVTILSSIPFEGESYQLSLACCLLGSPFHLYTGAVDEVDGELAAVPIALLQHKIKLAHALSLPLTYPALNRIPARSCVSHWPSVSLVDTYLSPPSCPFLCPSPTVDYALLSTCFAFASKLCGPVSDFPSAVAFCIRSISQCLRWRFDDTLARLHARKSKYHPSLEESFRALCRNSSCSRGPLIPPDRPTWVRTCSRL